MGTRLSLILGGARSGKSALAQEMANERGRKVLFVATAAAGDREMAERIAAHQADRPTHWHTVEALTQVAGAIRKEEENFDIVLIDCLTLLVSNLFSSPPDSAADIKIEQAMNAELDGLFLAYAESRAAWIVVSNEVGMGLVPQTPMGRLYRDVLGRANQRCASKADEVLLLVAGLPLSLKPPSGIAFVR